jgi:hypothetical protein
MAVSEILGLFQTPDQYSAAQDAAMQRQFLQRATLDPFQKASVLGQQAGYSAAQGIGGALGGKDPQLEMISRRNALLGQLNPSDPKSYAKVAEVAAQMGDSQFAVLIAQEGRKAEEQRSLVAQRGAAEQASLAQAAKTQLTIDQENKLRDELSKLGANPTQDQILSVVAKYGPPDKVLAVLQRSTDLAAQRETQLQLGREKIAAKLESDLRDAKNDAEKEKLRIEARKELALLLTSLKGPSAAVLKAQEKADKAAEGQIALGDTISTAETLVKDLAKTGGMTSTSKGPLANLLTSLQTGTAGQVAGRAFGTKDQAKRDELKSIRLQLLNAVKEATGMSSQQLNSNVELKTYLDSLGSEGMSKEANLAILENLSRRYLKGGSNMPSGGTGTAENPIVLK